MVIFRNVFDTPYDDYCILNGLFTLSGLSVQVEQSIAILMINSKNQTTFFFASITYQMYNVTKYIFL